MSVSRAGWGDAGKTFRWSDLVADDFVKTTWNWTIGPRLLANLQLVSIPPETAGEEGGWIDADAVEVLRLMSDCCYKWDSDKAPCCYSIHLLHLFFESWIRSPRHAI